MKSFCWNCFRIIEYGDAVCPRCDARQGSAPGGLYDQLIRALKHPLGEVRRRAIFVLGQKQAAHAADELAKVIERDPDPYVAREAIVALSQMRGAKAAEAIRRALAHKSFLVRNRALEALVAVGAGRADEERRIAREQATVAARRAAKSCCGARLPSDWE